MDSSSARVSTLSWYKSKDTQALCGVISPSYQEDVLSRTRGSRHWSVRVAEKGNVFIFCPNSYLNIAQLPIITIEYLSLGTMMIGWYRSTSWKNCGIVGKLKKWRKSERGTALRRHKR